jgi:hypothetical protein
METAVISTLSAALFGLNVYATYAIARDRALSAKQKAIQMSVVWLFPLVGAVFTIAIRGAQSESGPRLDPSNEMSTEQSVDMSLARDHDAGLADHSRHDP